VRSPQEPVNQFHVEWGVAQHEGRLNVQLDRLEVAHDDAPAGISLGLLRDRGVDLDADRRDVLRDRRQEGAGTAAGLDHAIIRIEVAKIALNECFGNPYWGGVLP
jgi:hypothetical protein